jgi:hypothetical protein
MCPTGGIAGRRSRPCPALSLARVSVSSPHRSVRHLLALAIAAMSA